MKKVITFLALLFPLVSLAQSTTPNLGFQIPATGSSNWFVPTNYNWQVLDQYLSGNKALPALTVTGAVSLPGLTITSAQINAAIGFTPLNPNNNLSDLQSKVTALTNLGAASIAGAAFTGPITSSAVNGVANVNQYMSAHTVDLGAAANALYAALPATGGLLQVNIPAGGISYTTPIVFGTAGKPVIFDCLANSGIVGTTTPGLITFTPNNATALTFDTGSGATSTHGLGVGTRNCSFKGANGTSIGLQLGVTNGAEGFEDRSSSFAQFGQDVVIGNQTWNVVFYHTYLQGSGQCFFMNNPSNSGEQIDFMPGIFDGCTTNGVQITGGNITFNCDFCQFDDAQLNVDLAQANIIAPHFENPSGPISYPFIINSGNMVLSGPTFSNDSSTGSATAMLSLTGGQTLITGLFEASSYGYPAIIAVSGSASFQELAPTLLGSLPNPSTPVSGTTTGFWVFDQGQSAANCSGVCPAMLTNRRYSFVTPGLVSTTDSFLRYGVYNETINNTNLQWRGFGTPDLNGWYTGKIQSQSETAGSNGCAGAYGSGIGIFTENKTAANTTDTSTQGALLDCNGNFHIKGNVYIGSGTAGTVGFTGTKTAGLCAITIVGGIITNVTGC